jgi:phosphate transport system permease protein
MRGQSTRRITEKIIEGVLFLSALSSVFITVGIVAVLFFETHSFFQQVSLYDFLTDAQWTPLFDEKHFGIMSLFAGTLVTTAIAMAVSLPLGITIAVYLSEYASTRSRTAIKPALEVLAAVPTVVYGYFALLLVTPFLQAIYPDLSGFNALAPGVVMGFMIVPTISSLSEDAMHAVPLSLREGAYALGSTKLQTSFRVVLPAAFSGIAASFILGVSRAVGETMVVAIAAGQQPRLTLNPLVPIETVTAYIVQVSLGDTPAGTLEYSTIFAAGMSLFVVTFILNLVSYWLRERFREVYH